jgi:crotonobetainyl-CoA:carnitine CoA-transferase CaiB-like acyl-CoA transferase
MPWQPFRLDAGSELPSGLDAGSEQPSGLATSGELPFRPAPGLGEHDHELAELLAAPRRRPKPAVDLSRVRVLEFGVAWAGPLAGRFLGELGAEVVKVEHPASRGLPVNAEFAESWQWGDLPHPQIRFPVFPDAQPGERWWNRSGMFNKMNRNKRSVSVDAKAPEGRAILDALIASSDVVLHNYSPRGAASLGIDAAGVGRHNRRGITVAMSGYGETGPLASYLSYGPILQAHAGFDEATGYEGAGPTRLGVAFPDPVGGVHGAFATLVALWERAQVDSPVHVDLSQFEALLSIAGEMVLATSVTGRPPERHGNRSLDHVPQNVYGCAGDDRWLALTVTGDQQWQRLVDLVGDPVLLAWRDAGVDERRQHAAAIDAAIARWTEGMDAWTAVCALQADGIAAFPAMTNGDLAEDPHLRERGFIALIDQPDVGLRGFPGCAIHCSRTPVAIRHCPTLGEDNVAVLGPLLGFGPADIAELEERDILASLPLYR